MCKIQGMKYYGQPAIIRIACSIGELETARKTQRSRFRALWLKELKIRGVHPP